MNEVYLTYNSDLELRLSRKIPYMQSSARMQTDFNIQLYFQLFHQLRRDSWIS